MRPSSLRFARWFSDNDYSSRLVEGEVVLAVTHRLYGAWDGFIEQTVIPHRSASARTRLAHFHDREAAQAAVEAFITGHRSRNAAFAASDAAALGRAALAARPAPDVNDEHRITASDVLDRRAA